jgi:hypothetical protein
MKKKDNRARARKKVRQHKTRNTCAFFRKINRKGNGYCQKKLIYIQTEFDCKDCKLYKKHPKEIAAEKTLAEAFRKVLKEAEEKALAQPFRRISRTKNE